jgi:cobalt/nickel transport system permease protein
MTTEGFWDRLDPRIKMICVVSLSAALALTPARHYRKFLGYALLIVLLALISRVRWKNYFMRILFLIPVLVFMALSLLFFSDSPWHQRVLVLWNLGVKTTLTMCSVGILVLTVRFPHLMKGLESMRVPKRMTGMVSFAYRYLFLFIQEAERLSIARKSRSFGKRKLWREWKTVLAIVSVFLSRVLDRSQTIYFAMLSRGYTGSLPNPVTLHLNRTDCLFVILFHLLLASTAVAL